MNLGFYTERNYVSQEDGAVADVAFSLNPSQKPVLTFTVEDADPMRLVSGALQWTGSATEPKSWMHICVFLGDPNDIPTVPNNIKQYDTQSLDHLPSELEDITKHMIILLSHYNAPNVPNVGDAVRSLVAVNADWPKGREKTRLSYKASARLIGDGLSIFSAEDEEDNEAGEPVLKPSRKVVPLEVVSGGASFEGALMRLVEVSDGWFLLSSEHRNYPFIFRLAVGERGGASELDLWFDVDKSNIPQVLNFWSLVEAVEKSRVVSLIGSSGEVTELTFP